MADNQPVFQTQKWVDILGGLIHHTRSFWVQLGHLESKLLQDEMSAIPIKKPIYVSGLARSGSTLLLEILSRYPKVISHQYKDFPPIYTPYWWHWFLSWMPKQKIEPIERAHRDGIFVTPESPEAMEEMLWMTFFPTVHDPTTTNILDQNTTHATFEKFYIDHIRKLLLVKKGNRYLAKGNYNIARLEYILKLFPEARFIIPIRQPVTHIASLMKQHQLFCLGEKENPKALKHLQRVGHFEFGLDIRPINLGHHKITQEIMTLLANQQAVQAWSYYWSEIYNYLADRLDQNPKLREASMIIRFEDLCESPQKTIKLLMTHCGLTETEDIIREFAEKIRNPTYYKPHFSEDELAVIHRETHQAAQRFGY